MWKLAKGTVVMFLTLSRNNLPDGQTESPLRLKVRWLNSLSANF